LFHVPNLFQCSICSILFKNSHITAYKYNLTNKPPWGEKIDKMINRTYQAVDKTLVATNASAYLVRLIHETKVPITKRVDPVQLLKEVPYYQAKNREGYNVYFRPAGYEFVLLDDLHREALPELARLKPCLLLETSPGNYQAWLRLREVPQAREEAVNICQELAVLFAADMGSAEPDHVGRLPGFTNRKPKHRQEDGLYPFVKLYGSEDRVSTFSPQGGLVGQIDPIVGHHKKTDDHDRSRQDFNLCCILLSQGKTDDYIRQELEAKSEKAREVRRSFDYIGKTIRNARIRLGTR
jgi:hypothetical protein